MEARIATSARKTLGTLVGDLLGSYLVIDENDEIEPPANAESILPEDAPFSCGMKIELGLSAANFARTKSGLKELVLLRNTLVHDFINQYDIQSVDGCRVAIDALIAAYIRIEHHFEELREWAEDLDRGRRQMLEIFQQDSFHEIVASGIELNLTTSALREAADACAADGWTSVDGASRWIAERYPERTPKKIGCSSWRQAIHELRLFDIKYFEVDGVRTACYREKEGSANSC